MPTEPSRTTRTRSRLPLILAFALLALSLAACWIIPLRLMRESWHTFGYLGDEYLYAQRIQPLIPGTAATNTMNGVGDPNVISPFYLEDFLRSILSLTRIDVIAFVWAWRWLFPLALVAGFYALARVTLFRPKRVWNSSLRWAATAAAIPLLYCIYDLVTVFPPFHGFIDRFPTNIEFPLSVLLAAQYLAFLKNPTARAGVLLALLSAATAYLRLYLAFPWAITMIGGFGYLIATRQITARVVLITAAVLIGAMIPWALVNRFNSSSPVFADLMMRYFGAPATYSVHGRWFIYAGAAAVLMASAFLLKPRQRVFAIGAGATLLLLPFICALLPFASEVMQFDRFGAFYLVALLAAAMLAIGSRGANWRGHAAIATSHRVATGVALSGFIWALILVNANATYDLAKYPDGPLPSVRQDLPFIPAYTWLRENSPPDALVLVDDGYDWSIKPRRNAAGQPVVSGIAPDGSHILAKDDLFQIVARRRRVYTHRLMTNVLATSELKQLAYLQRGTLGLPVPREYYEKSLEEFRPSYILWRKNTGAPVPRGFGVDLKPRSKIVFQDDFAEIWKLDFPLEKK